MKLIISQIFDHIMHHPHAQKLQYLLAHANCCVRHEAGTITALVATTYLKHL
jgi:hypothetical protein